jgi:aminopeptidase
MLPTAEFEKLLAKYAQVAIKVGLNLQPGQRLMIINPPVETAPLVRLVTKCAYEAGARYVAVIWQDEQLRLLQLRYGSRESLEEFPTWNVTAMKDYAENGGAQLAISSRHPDLFAGQDPEALKIIQRTTNRNLAPVNKLISQNAMNWSVVAAPIDGWAAKVFPDMETDDAIAHLWDTIFEVCRIKRDDPVDAWKRHVADLQARSAYLTQKAYTALKYRAPGTDLTIGLPEGHIWLGGSVQAGNGITCVPNLPTEEVFTLPHQDRVEGVVTATKPLSYQGAMMEDFTLTFEKGHVVNVQAKIGEAILKDLISTDEGGSALGEVALVPNSSPVSRTGKLFYNTLFDENASCHLALGRAYNVSLQGGAALTDEQFAAAGGNSSLIHVDFMVGSDALDIDGIRAGGGAEAVMRGGEWVFDPVR